jgi:predicted amidohydrolase|nr:nitrilase-related carbon-nitrogen hydrolase [Kofleriaceae bacterium]
MATLIAVQLEIGDAVLASPDAYRSALDRAAAAAIADAPRSDATLLVFPELAGHLALYAQTPPRARRARTLAAALGSAALRRPLDVLRGVATAHVLDPRHAVLAALAPDGERMWRAIFGPLARRHGCFVVAGSHLRLAPNGELTNASLLFAADGRLLATTDKVNLVPGLEDGSPTALKLARGTAARVPIVDTETPLGKLATLIGYDGARAPRTTGERWESVGDRLALRGGVDVVANPSANADGLPATLAARGVARFGVTAHLVGRVLDLAFGGCSEIVAADPATGAVRVLSRAPDASHGGHVHAQAGR